MFIVNLFSCTNEQYLNGTIIHLIYFFFYNSCFFLFEIGLSDILKLRNYYSSSSSSSSS
ncbi:hypothetical protein FWK35_00000766, partial [Aphis craccivora]